MPLRAIVTQTAFVKQQKNAQICFGNYKTHFFFFTKTCQVSP